MSGAGYVARMCVWGGGEGGRERGLHTAVFFWDGEDLRDWDLLELLSVDGTIIQNESYRNRMGEHGQD